MIFQPIERKQVFCLNQDTEYPAGVKKHLGEGNRHNYQLLRVEAE